MKTKSLFFMAGFLLFGGIMESNGQVMTNYVTSYGYTAGTAGHSVYVGSQAGTNTIPYTTGGTSLFNTYIGHQAGYGNVTNSPGNLNTFLGSASGYNNNTGSQNLFLGAQSGYKNTSGSWNVFSGLNSGYENLTGNYNLFSGFESGKKNTSGSWNVFLGTEAGKENISGRDNVCVGGGAGQSSVDKIGNTYLGFAAGQFNKGELNVYVGNAAGRWITAGNSNILIGNGAGPFTAPTNGILNNALYINNIPSDTPLILGQFGGTPTLRFNGQVTVDGNGGAGTSGLKFTDLNNTHATVSNASAKVLSVNASGDVILVNDLQGSGGTINSALTSSVNTMTSAVNGSSSDAPIVNSISNTIANGQLTTTVNGVASAPVTLPSGGVDTDAQTLTVTGNQLAISNGNTVTLPTLTEVDGDVTNELQNLSLTGNVLSISNGNSLTLPSSNVVDTNTNIYNSNGDLSENRLVGMNGKNLIFNTGGSTNGRIYIGNTTAFTTANFPTTTGNYRLNVEGGILTEKVKVALRSSANWADYVFADNYKLMPLKEVEAFVKENKHLPGVVSAENLTKEGLDLGQMQAKQMEKIEELTLYVIEQNKTIEKQSKEIEELKAMVNALVNKTK